MPNMTYCAAENTCAAMTQLLDLIESGEKNDVFNEQAPHNYEARAIEDISYLAKELSNACTDLIDKYGN
jgi:hypothetical protein